MCPRSFPCEGVLAGKHEYVGIGYSGAEGNGFQRCLSPSVSLKLYCPRHVQSIGCGQS